MNLLNKVDMPRITTKERKNTRSNDLQDHIGKDENEHHEHQNHALLQTCMLWH